MLAKLFRTSLLLCLALAFASADAVARDEGGSDSGHTGGGGTFIQCTQAKQFPYWFWDLYRDCQQIPAGEDSGDRITLSPAGLRAGGEWVNFSQLKSYRFLRERLKKWDNWNAGSVYSAEAILPRDLNFLATSLSITSVSEIQVAPGFDKGAVTPGAYFDYATHRLYVDVKIWNQAGLHSQAALLLHEMWRSVQQHFKIPNYQIQWMVRRVINHDPYMVYNKDGTINGCGWLNDYQFQTIPNKLDLNYTPFALPSGRALRLNEHRPAPSEVAAARANEILGDKQILITPETAGRFQIHRAPDYYQVPNSCLDGTDEDY